MTTNNNTQPKPRNIHELLYKDVPYSDMTEEELETIIEWKANIKYRDKIYETNLDNIKQEMLKRAETFEKEYLNRTEIFTNLCNQALANTQFITEPRTNEQKKN